MAFFQLFKNKKGQYRWRLRANNNKIIADSAESYVRKRDCMYGIRLLKAHVRKAKLTDKTVSSLKRKK